jgi:DNA polymerase III subunit epsilon
MRQIILDTETTGLEPEQGHRIIEIGCVELINRRK